MKSLVLAIALVASLVTPAVAEQSYYFTNVNVFDGVTDELLMDRHVLVSGNMITEVSEEPLVVIQSTDMVTIDGQGMTLMPGLIDSHVHFNLMVPGGPAGLESSTWEFIGAMATVTAREWLYNGFTTARDMGGMHDGLRRAIDDGFAEGPRLYVAGGFLSQTCGHGDFRFDSQVDAAATNQVGLGISRIVDGRDEMLKATRQNLFNGADYFKVMIGGGVSSPKDPLHSLQFTPDEILAAVEVAEMWDTYVACHVYHDEHIQRGLDLGIKVFDHAQFITEDTCRNLKDADAFISPNTAGMNPALLSHPVYGNPEGPQYPKVVEFQERSKHLFDVLKKVQPKIVFNTDVVFTQGAAMRAVIDHEKWSLANGIGNFEALRAMTSRGGELAALTGKNNPYPDAKLGVIEVGAYADIIIVDGNPLEDITVIGGNEEWLDAAPRDMHVEPIRLIMKNGRIYKNTI
jgi:imidazolonepropionase-like amidohydrolase